MAIQYQLYTQDEQDEAIAEAMRGREIEHFHYDLNYKNYIDMLPNLPVGNEKGTPEEQAQFKYRKHVESLIATEAVARDQTEVVYNALAAKLDDPTRKAAAFAKVAEKVAAQKAKELATTAEAAVKG